LSLWIGAAAGFDFCTQAAKDYVILGRMKFAMLAKLPSEQAARQADSPGNIERFERLHKGDRVA
jgi:hypothetical protein